MSCTFHLEQKIVSCIIHNEIWTYCQWRDIAVRAVASFSSWGSACISPRRLNGNCSISQLLGCDVKKGDACCGVCTCVYLPVCAGLLCFITVVRLHLRPTRISPCLQPSCCLHVTMETQVATHEPITAQWMLESCIFSVVSGKSVCLLLSNDWFVFSFLLILLFHCHVKLKRFSKI